jgi:hypothetical protein
MLNRRLYIPSKLVYHQLIDDKLLQLWSLPGLFVLAPNIGLVTQREGGQLSDAEFSSVWIYDPVNGLFIGSLQQISVDILSRSSPCGFGVGFGMGIDLYLGRPIVPIFLIDWCSILKTFGGTSCRN